MSDDFIREVEHVARLARLLLNSKEKELMADQLGAILDTARKVREIDTAGIEPTAHVFSIPAFLREDAISPSLPVEKVLQNAPKKMKSYFLVPSITAIEEE